MVWTFTGILENRFVGSFLHIPLEQRPEDIEYSGCYE
jgi:hypothetical protein